MFVLVEEACNSSVFNGSCAMCNQFTGEWVIKTNHTQMASKGCGNGTTLLSDILQFGENSGQSDVIIQTFKVSRILRES